MAVEIAGFIIALVLAALVVLWIAYCMFVREKPKSELYQYNITDLQRRNCVMSMSDEAETPKKDVSVGVGVAGVGVFVLPSRRRQKDEGYDTYDKRPDYPESPVPVSHPSTDKLIEILDNVDADVHYKDGIYEVDSAPYHSDV